MTPPASDGAFARWLAERAGAVLLNLRHQQGYGDQPALRAAGDAQSHELITTELARWRAADAVLSEEGARTDPVRLTADRVWIVDPLDGTREFGEEGRDDWAVHIGLWRRDNPAAVGGPHSERTGRAGRTGRMVAGAVAMPARDQVLDTDNPPPAPTGIAGHRLKLAVSRTRPASFLGALAEAVDGELVPMGSAGVKIAAVIIGTVDAYVHAGGQHEWDSAAPVAVATATGLHASRIDGSALEYNQADPRLPDLLVCREDLAPELLAALARSGGSG